MFHLLDLGWNAFFENQLREEERGKLVPARVAEEGRGLFRLWSEGGEWLAEPSGRLRYEARQRYDLPAVGDWVVAQPRPGERKALIQRRLERRSKFSRKVAGPRTEEQVLAANIDTVLLVSALNREFRLRRIERYLALAAASGAQPVVVLNKADLCDDPAAWVRETQNVAPDVAVHAVSALTGWGMQALQAYLRIGQTVALLGSSGVGKSTLVNLLLGDAQQRVGPVRESDGRGRHTTTARQLILLPGGGILVDTPGLRELQLWESEEGLEHAFADIEALAHRCHFTDCQHLTEPGCAVRGAIENGALDSDRLESHHKLEREQRYLERRRDLAAQAEERKRWKKLHKALRDHSKNRWG